MADLRIVDAPVLLQESITDDVKMPTGGLGNYAIRLGDLVWYVVAKENLASKSYVDTSSKGVQNKLDNHIANKNNPHEVTKEQVGLGNVDNTADVDKPVSNAVSSAIITATNDMATKTYVNQQDNLKADKATTLSGYGIKDAYTKNEINTSISLKADTSYVDGKSGDLTTLTTTDKSSLVKAVNEVYDKTALFYNNVADMVADTKLKAGKAVITHGYWLANDGGGARYLISSSATDYSIPVANGLHAVFADSFDIRKFGIVSSATQDQTTNLVRMRNYADTRVYMIDFLNYDIVVPDSNAGCTGAKKSVNGLWFEKAHHIKNLNITIDKSKRLETGKCPLIFCPTKDAPSLQEVVYENITLDCWNDNYQPITDNYWGAWDGLRCGILIHPKIWFPELDSIETNYTSNYVFKFLNIKFKSQAYSYNISQAIRAKQVIVDNLSGDCFLMFGIEADKFYGRNIEANVRWDRLESGRGMVMDALHIEAEMGGKTGIKTEIISLDNCSCMRTNKNGTQEKGQLAWFTSLVDTHYNKLLINNCTGTITLQNSLTSCDFVEVTNCNNGIWLSFNNATINDILVENSTIRYSADNPGFGPTPFYKVKLNSLRFVRTKFESPFYTENSTLESLVKNVFFDDCHAVAAPNVNALFTDMVWENVTFNNCDFSAYRQVLRFVKATKSILVKTSKLGFDSTDAPIALVYLPNHSTNSTKTQIINSEYVGGILQSGTVDFINCYGNNIPYYETPYGQAGYLGTNTIKVTYDKFTSPELVQKFNINQSVGANSNIIITKSVKDFCKDVTLRWANDPGVNVSTAVFGTTAKITLTNTTTAPITVNSDVTLTQIV